jgi:hypothetical protein
MIEIILIEFCLIFTVTCRPVEVSYVTKLPVINTPYGRRQAHAMAVDGKVLLRWGHWRRLNQWQQRELLYHELTHLAGCGHSTEKDNIMNPHSPNIYWVNKDASNWWKLITNLKKHINDCRGL